MNIKEVKTAVNLVVLARKYPEQNAQLYSDSLAKPEEYARLVKTAVDLVMLAREFPEQKAQLYSDSLAKPEEYARLVKTPHDLDMLADEFPEQKAITRLNPSPAATTNASPRSSAAFFCNVNKTNKKLQRKNMLSQTNAYGLGHFMPKHLRNAKASSSVDLNITTSPKRC